MDAPSGDQRTRGLSDPAHVHVVNALTAASLLCVFLWSAFFNSNMWLPKEIVFAQKGEGAEGQVIEGYVLGIDGGWMNVLDSGKRKIRRVPTAWIKQRTICLHHATEPLWWIGLPWIDEPASGRPPPGCKVVRERVERAHPGATTTHEG